jgi:response regulator RpfG family c-di-GMP phosphodiesterase
MERPFYNRFKSASMANDKIKILYIDDEENNLSSFKASFRKDYDIYTASTAALGREILNDVDIEIVITDQRMPEMTGVEFLESIASDFPKPIRMILTGYSDMPALVAAVNKGGIYRYISKPWNADELKMFIEQAYEVYRLREDKEHLTKKLKTVNAELESLISQRLL